MAVSGTVGQSQFTLQKVFDSAFRRCGIPMQVVTAEYLDTAKDLLNLTLSEFVTTGVSLWTNGVSYMGMQAGLNQLVMPDGTLEIDRIVLLMTNLTSATISGASSTWNITASASVSPEFLGLRVSSAGFYTLAIDTSPDGVTWTQTETIENVQIFTAQWNWIEFSPPPAATTFFRIRETSTSATIPLTGATLAVGSSEREISVLGQDEYANLPGKRTKGTVTSYYTDRQVDGPILYLWNAPDDAHADYILQVWRKRHIIDVGDMTGRIEVPQRWMDAIIWDLAWRLAAEIPETKKQPEQLLPFAERARAGIAPSETDGGTFSAVPDIGMYTA